MFGVYVAEPCPANNSSELRFPEQECEYLAQYAAHRLEVFRRVLQEQEQVHEFKKRWGKYPCGHLCCCGDNVPEKKKECKGMRETRLFLHILNGCDDLLDSWRADVHCRSKFEKIPWSFEREGEFYGALESIALYCKAVNSKIGQWHDCDRELELAVVILEETVARALHGKALFLDLLQKAQHYAWHLNKEHGWYERLTQLDAIVKASPILRTQLEDFCKFETQDVRESLEQLPAERAVEVMKRGPLRNREEPLEYNWKEHEYEDSMYELRSRLFSGSAVTAENARACAKLRNAEFAELYRSMSKKELQEELRNRGVRPGRTTSLTNQNVQDRLRQSDALWVDTAKMTTVDVETFAFLQAKEVVSGLTEDERTRLKLHIALEREENHLTILKKEGFFAPLAGYSSAELVHLTQKLGLRVPEEGYDERTALIDACTVFVDARHRTAERIRMQEHRAPCHESWVKDSVPDASAKLANRYRDMSVQMLQDACRDRRLSEHTHTYRAVKRRPAAQGGAGTLAQTLRGKLECNDRAWDEKVPADGVEDLSTSKLRALAAALDIKQGDRSKGELLSAINNVQEQREMILRGAWQLKWHMANSQAADSDDDV